MLHLVSLVARVSVIVADTIVIAVTWVTLRHQVKEAFDLKMRSQTSTVMLADGMLTFIFIGVSEAHRALIGSVYYM